MLPSHARRPSPSSCGAHEITFTSMKVGGRANRGSRMWLFFAPTHLATQSPSVTFFVDASSVAHPSGPHARPNEGIRCPFASREEIDWESLLPPIGVICWMAFNEGRRFIEIEPAVAVPDLR